MYRQTQAENAAGADLFQITNSYAQVQLGVGLILNNNISVRPGVDIPVGLGGTSPIVGLTLGYNFGNSRR
jgi:hypothetical protein